MGLCNNSCSKKIQSAVEAVAPLLLSIELKECRSSVGKKSREVLPASP